MVLVLFTSFLKMLCISTTFCKGFKTIEWTLTDSTLKAHKWAVKNVHKLPLLLSAYHLMMFYTKFLENTFKSFKIKKNPSSICY